MKSTGLILLFAIAAILAFFEVNAEPLANPVAEPMANSEALSARRPVKNILFNCTHTIYFLFMRLHMMQRIVF